MKVGGITEPKSMVEAGVPLSTLRGVGRGPKGGSSVAMAAEHLLLQVAEGLLFPLESGQLALLPPAGIVNLPWANHEYGFMPESTVGGVGANVGDPVGDGTGANVGAAVGGVGASVGLPVP